MLACIFGVLQVAAYEQQFQEALSFMQTAFSELSLTYAEAFSGTSPAKLPSDFSPTTRSFKMVAECTVTRERGRRLRNAEGRGAGGRQGSGMYKGCVTESTGVLGGGGTRGFPFRAVLCCAML